MKESIKEKIELAIIALVAVCICFGFLWWSAYQATQLQKKKGAQIMETLKRRTEDTRKSANDPLPPERYDQKRPCSWPQGVSTQLWKL